MAASRLDYTYLFHRYSSDVNWSTILSSTFTARRMQRMLAGYSCRRNSVHPSVRLSHACFVTKPNNALPIV